MDTPPRKELDPELLEILACPKCKGDLEYRREELQLICHSCRLRYRIIDHPQWGLIPNMLIKDAEPF
ncbi:MAG: Trm112 family protein [bacterium]